LLGAISVNRMNDRDLQTRHLLIWTDELHWFSYLQPSIALPEQRTTAPASHDTGALEEATPHLRAHTLRHPLLQAASPPLARRCGETTALPVADFSHGGEGEEAMRRQLWLVGLKHKGPHTPISD